MKISEKIDPDYLMCMVCFNCCYYKDGHLECEYEDEEGNCDPKLRKNYDCDAFEFNKNKLVEVLVRLVKEIRGK